MNSEKLFCRRKFAAVVGSMLLLALSTGCTKRYPMQGEVVSTSVATNEVTVNHGDIPGFMPAMAMPYRVKDPSVLQELQPGDKITAQVVVEGDRSRYWLEDVRVTDTSGRGQASSQAGSQGLAEGKSIPNVVLTNQDGRHFRLSDFGGKAVLVTFIYTRCPMPNFCPRLSSQFAKIHEELKKSPEDYAKTHLLTISFDPKYDTPAVLRKYGLAYLDGDQAGFSHWDFATGDAPELRRLAEALGTEYEDQGDQIVHTMNIVLIAPDGKVAKSWSTDWTATELLASLEQAERPAPSRGQPMEPR